MGWKSAGRLKGRIKGKWEGTEKQISHLRMKVYVHGDGIFDIIIINHISGEKETDCISDRDGEGRRAQMMTHPAQ